MHRFAMLPILGTVSVDDLYWHSQAYTPIDASLTSVIMLGIRMKRMDFMSQKVSGLIARVRDKRLFFTQLWRPGEGTGRGSRRNWR